MAQYPPTVKELLEMLSKYEDTIEFAFCPRKYRKNEVKFEFDGYLAKTPISYRGFYDHLCFMPDTSPGIKTVGDFKESLKQATRKGNIHYGYKGGDFTMNLNTPVWVDHYGGYAGYFIDKFKMDDTGKLKIILNQTEVL